MDSSATTVQAGTTTNMRGVGKSPQRKASFSQARVAELQSIPRASSVREIKSKFEGAKTSEPQDNLQKRTKVAAINSDRLLKFAISSSSSSTTQKSPVVLKKTVENPQESPIRVNVPNIDSTVESKGSPMSMSPQLSPILKNHQQWTIEKKSAILSQWSQAMMSENPTALITTSAAEESLANLGISPLTLDSEQWQEWHNAIEEIVSKHQSSATNTSSPQTTLVTRLFDHRADQDTPSSTQVDTSTEDVQSEEDEDSSSDHDNDTVGGSCTVEVYTTETISESNASKSSVTTHEKSLFDQQHLAELSTSTIHTTHLFESISPSPGLGDDHSMVTSDGDDSISIEINKRVKKKISPVRNESNVKIRRGSMRSASGAIHITNNVVLDTTGGKDDKPEQLSWLHLVVAVLSAIILSGLAYYFLSHDGQSLASVDFKTASVFSNVKLVDFMLPNAFTATTTNIQTEPVQVFAVNSITESDTMLVDFNGSTPLRDASSVDALLPLKSEAATSSAQLSATLTGEINNVAQKDIPANIANAPLPLAVSEYNQADSEENSSEEPVADSPPISMKISIMMRKPTKRWSNPFAGFRDKIGSFFGKLRQLFSRKKKQNT